MNCVTCMYSVQCTHAHFIIPYNFQVYEYTGMRFGIMKQAICVDNLESCSLFVYRRNYEFSEMD